MPKVDSTALIEAGAEACRAVGYTPVKADTASRVLVRNSLRGVMTHGIWMLPIYLEIASKGGARPEAELEIITDRGSAIVVDGGGGFGVLVAEGATRLGIERAKSRGMSNVAVRNSNHFAAAGYYALMGAEAGVITIVTSNGPPVMTLAGTAGKAVCTQPFAYGVPNAPDDCPIVLDMALSWVAGRKVMLAEERGEQIPEHWIVDSEGRPSSNPGDLRPDGAMVVMAGHKGSGLAVLVELLSGVLPGAGVTFEVGSQLRDMTTPTKTGHNILSVDVESFMDLAEFQERTSQFCHEVRSARLAPGVDRIYVPGELEHERERQARAEGLWIDDDIWQELLDMGTRYGVEKSFSGAIIE